ncbi:U-box domain-containing protein 33-like isoform X1 [Musa acuminata AAA Group]|uniref:U-box domain-containing protein 33-like isoform X1 n=1 Tax=Musa acuminata AAA Group TaxID=214697 RepID=UPI0031D100C1
MDMKSSVSSVGSSSFFSTGSSRSSLKEIEEEAQTPEAAPSKKEGENGEDDKIHVAVEKDFKLSKANLVWVLKNTPRTKKIVIVHVHVPAQMIPMLGAWFPADQLKSQEVSAYRQIEKAKMEKAVNEYVKRCSIIKEVQAEKLVIEADDVCQGLVQLIAQHKITNLVMGAAADKKFSKKMKEPMSKKALLVQEQADPSCNLWFVCKGNLICTREASPTGTGKMQTTRVIPRAVTAQSERSNSKTPPSFLGQLFNFFPNTSQEKFRHQSVSATSGLSMPDLSHGGSGESSSGSREGIVIDLWDGISRSSQSSAYSMHSVNDEVLSSTSSMQVVRDEINGGTLVLPSSHDSEDRHQSSTLNHNMEDAGLDDELYKDLQHAVKEANNLTREAYEEALRRRKAERDLHDAAQKVKTAEDLYTTEKKQRKEIEERLSKEKREMEELRKQQNEMFEALQKADKQKATLEQQVIDSNRIIRDLENKLSDAHYLLISLQSEYVELRRERDDAVKKAEELHQKLEEMATSIQGEESFFEFSYSELEKATNSFDDSLKIGEGGYGSVYKGTLGQKTVAIKKLNSEGMQGQKEFHKEINVLSKLRHPNLVNLIGTCVEAWALVYAFFPNGSLEDRLTCKDNTPPLTWQIRIRVAAEICSALNFLHSNKHLSVVHGDLKPANILLDANFVSKLGDFGICRLVQSNNNTTLYRCTHAMGTFVYMDPEFLASGEITPLSDIYSFGIILLRLLTGRSPFGINRAVQQALNKGCLSDILDASAGNWPYAEAKQLACLGLRCCEITRRSRPDAGEAWNLLEPLVKSVSLPELSLKSSP